MSAAIVVPDLGEGVSEATLARWCKAPGEHVQKDEVLVVLEADKASVEVVAETTGIVASVTATAGDLVAVGAVIGAIAESNSP
ncbi:biotin/lipoyl-containing protein [Terricaulis sp.]|uniref:biotin/lipoyl-containing protein n=1 Tax=Terricaulis sp. TaxID=2768686 RepID=UPI003782F350